MLRSRWISATVAALVVSLVPALAQELKPTIAREGQAKMPVPEVPKPDPKSAKVPQGYRVEAAWTGLTYPTSVEVDAAGTVYVAEAGFSYGDEQAAPRILRLLPDGKKEVFIDKGLMGPINDLLWTGDRLYISHKGMISFWRADGLHHVVKGLPSFGSHQNNQLTMGPDKRIYFGQGTATNSGVVGLDSFEMGWLKKNAERHDVPARDITLEDDAKFQTPDPIEPLKNTQNRLVETSPFHPFGKTGTEVKGMTKANGTILRMNLDGAGLEVHAWGLRNPFGVLWGPDGKLYATEQGFDERGSRPIANAPDNLWIIKPDAWYGWPDYASGRPVTDTKYASERGPVPKFVMKDHPPVEKPLLTLPVHSAAAKFAFSPMHGTFGFPGQMFLAMFGDLTPMTGTEMRASGFQVARIDLETGVVEPFLHTKPDMLGTKGVEYFATAGPKRPIDVGFTPEGDQMLVVDFGAVAIVETATGPTAHPQPGTGVLWRIYREGSNPRPLGFGKP